MKKIYRIITLLLTVSLMLGVAACGRGGGGNENKGDPTKSKLKIGIQEGGFGLVWLENLADEFEALYAEKSFEEGKKGIEITVEPTKSLAADCSNYVKGEDFDLCVTEQTVYLKLIRDGVAKDVNRLVTTPLTEYGETRSIADKLSDDNRTFYGNGNNDGHYYGVPWYACFFGINYDIQLFEDKGLYIAAKTSDGGNPDSYGCIKNKNAKRGNGPDGVYGTDDDGLPATYDEFFNMCDKICSLGMIPMIWTGKQQNYYPFMAQAWSVDYEGYDQYRLNFTLDGTAENLIEVDDEGNITELADVQINDTNGYLLQKQAGKYYSLKFFDRLINTKVNGKTKYIDAVNQCFSNSLSHKGAQGAFVSSRYEDSAKTIAMLLEGSWWYNEASNYFKLYSSYEGGSSKERRIGIMPIPKVDEEHLGEATFLNHWTSNIFINNAVPAEREEAAEMFFRFMHTDKALSAYTRETNTVRPYNYEISAADEAQCSPFAKQLVKIYRTAKIVDAWSLNNVVTNNTNAFSGNYNSIIGSGSAQFPFVSLYQGVTPEQYFTGLSKYLTKELWDITYSQYFVNK